MRRTLTTAAIAAGLLATTLTACSSNPTTSTSDKPKASQATDSVNARCRAQHWPQPMPNVAGKQFDPLSKDLQCFDKIKALAPDGHDVMNDTGGDVQSWIVASSQPGSGAQVSLSTPIILKLRDPSASPSATRTPTHAATTKAATRQPAPVQTTHHTTAPPVDDHGGATALCNDGSLSYSLHHRGTCSHHDGVAVWYK